LLVAAAAREDPGADVPAHGSGRPIHRRRVIRIAAGASGSRGPDRGSRWASPFSRLGWSGRPSLVRTRGAGMGDYNNPTRERGTPSLRASLASRVGLVLLLNHHPRGLNGSDS